MKWAIKLIWETVPGSPVEHEVGMIERAEEISPASLIDDSRRQSTTRKSAGTNRDRAGSTTCCQHQVLSAMRQCVSLKGILPFHSAFHIRQSWHARPTTQSMPMLRIAGAELLNIVYEQEPHHARVAV